MQNQIILPIVIGVIRDSEGRLLLGRRHEPETPFVHDKWNFLGGRVEFGELPEETLVREIKEESGLEIEIVRMIPKIFTKFRTKADGTKMHIVPITFECLVTGGTMHDPIPDPGVSELRFFHPQEIFHDDLIDGEHAILEIILKN